MHATRAVSELPVPPSRTHWVDGRAPTGDYCGGQHIYYQWEQTAAMTDDSVELSRRGLLRAGG
ncbi:hypothetical protein HLRTI_002830, partial [Halorhabdus tiamatea SARL4B]